MTDAFLVRPVLNSPYEIPGRFQELDDVDQPTWQIAETRRKVDVATLIPNPRSEGEGQLSAVLDEGKGLSTESQSYLRARVNESRAQVGEWRQVPSSACGNA